VVYKETRSRERQYALSEFGKKGEKHVQREET